MAYHSAFSVGGARFHDVEYEGPVETVVYGCWRRELFSRIGWFDTELARNQDDELNLRIARAGGQLWQNPAIRSWYYPRSTLRSVFMQYFQYGYWKVRVIQKHRVPASMRHLVPGVFVTCVGVVALIAPFSSVSTAVLVLLIGSHTIASITASVWACSRTGDFRNLPVLPAVFACYHVGYGLGFLRGVWDFVIRRRASVGFDNLTR